MNHKCWPKSNLLGEIVRQIFISSSRKIENFLSHTNANEKHSHCGRNRNGNDNDSHSREDRSLWTVSQVTPTRRKPASQLANGRLAVTFAVTDNDYHSTPIISKIHAKNRCQEGKYFYFSLDILGFL